MGKWLAWTLWVVVVALLGYETVTLYTTQPDDTISELVWKAASRRPIIPFLAGLLAGHLFWQKAD